MVSCVLWKPDGQAFVPALYTHVWELADSTTQTPPWLSHEVGFPGGLQPRTLVAHEVGVGVGVADGVHSVPAGWLAVTRV